MGRSTTLNQRAEGQHERERHQEAQDEGHLASGQQPPAEPGTDQNRLPCAKLMT
jgi:hypothetical protein